MSHQVNSLVFKIEKLTALQESTACQFLSEWSLLDSSTNSKVEKRTIRLLRESEGEGGGVG